MQIFPCTFFYLSDTLTYAVSNKNSFLLALLVNRFKFDITTLFKMKNTSLLFVIFLLSFSLSTFSQESDTNTVLVHQNTKTLLPEVLLSFDAIIVDGKVELTWSTNSEYNNNLFTIEKSKDALSFEEVISIKNFGNFSSLMSYFDVDFYPYEGISYYRLKQIDAQGKMLSSRLVSINNTTSTMMALNDVYSDKILGSENTEELVVLRNENGEEHFSKVLVDNKNEITITPDNDYKIENGTYTVIASSNNRLYSRKVVVK